MIQLNSSQYLRIVLLVFGKPQLNNYFHLSLLLIDQFLLLFLILVDVALLEQKVELSLYMMFQIDQSQDL